ncbi:hypothetical protein MFERI13461_00352 [Mycoplasma feriruminatoris]|uniref:hypothetical protein n=1 Tax=Mycoplasma feriruminatoris TaxID=1179777 RepID=UPI00241E5D73|nr:hypothetical protein [Mycoplasma feriruminatoris]WFQ90924.1 hypothetical protein MFERI13461_00352 [Mycoplasma feriruminatoris]
MKKLLVLLSSSVLLSLSFSSIYLLNYKNNNQVVLKQENKEETDLTKIFDRGYVSIVSKNGQPSKETVIEAIKKKYDFVDFTQLDIEVGIERNGRKSNIVIIKPKTNITNNKYRNSGEIEYYLKRDIASEIKDNEDNLSTISINTEEEILKKFLENIETSSSEVKDFFVTELTESTALVNAKDSNDTFYGKIKVKFNAKIKTLKSVFYNFNLELKPKYTENDAVVYIKNKIPSLKSEKISAKIDYSKSSANITVENSQSYSGSVALKITVKESEKPKPSSNEENIAHKLSMPRSPKQKPESEKQSEPISKNDITPNEKTKPELENTQPRSSESKPEPSPKSEPNKTTPIIDKSQNKNSDNKILSIPNNTMNKSNKKSTGSKTGVIVGSTLGVGSVVGIGAAGSWIYFKKRK